MYAEPEPEQRVGWRAKRLVLLATDVVLADAFPPGWEPASTAAELVRSRTLPACYRSRYDARFLEIFHSTLEVTRNMLVADLPFVINTAGELAAHAIFRAAERMLAGEGWELAAAAAPGDAELAGRLLADPAAVEEELEALKGLVLEDADVLRLFDVPPDEDPEEHIVGPEGLFAWPLLRFENWLVPFGNPPRPQITADGRAWPT